MSAEVPEVGEVGEAWRAALAAEQRAVFAYGVLGPHAGGADRDRVVASQDAHERLRDETTAALAAAGTPPRGRPPTTRTPIRRWRRRRPCARPPWPSSRRARRPGATCTRSRRRPAADRRSALRAHAQDALTGTAVRAARWRRTLDPAHPTVAFPGI